MDSEEQYDDQSQRAPANTSAPRSAFVEEPTPLPSMSDDHIRDGSAIPPPTTSCQEANSSSAPVKPEDDPRWALYLNRDGLSAVRKGASDRGEQSTSSSIRVLPTGCIDGESSTLDEVELPITFTDAEIDELETNRLDIVVAISATAYGPKQQEKVANEDFALSAVIKGPEGEPWGFAAVSDGVSTRTFWAARTSRIACCTAYKVMRDFVRAGGELSDDALDQIRAEIVDGLKKSFLKDQSRLRSTNIIPAGFTDAIYSEYIDRDEYWYNATLLVTLIGPPGGFIIWAGDGAILVEKQSDPAGPRAILRSSDNLAIDRYVSLLVEDSSFRRARIHRDGSQGVTIYLSSDGVDRTLQRSSRFPDYTTLPFDDAKSARTLLDTLSTLDECEIDNLSIARVSCSWEKSISRADSPKQSEAVDPEGEEPILAGPSSPPPRASRQVPSCDMLPFSRSVRLARESWIEGRNTPRKRNGGLFRRLHVSSGWIALIAGICIGVVSTRTLERYWRNDEPPASAPLESAIEPEPTTAGRQSPSPPAVQLPVLPLPDGSAAYRWYAQKDAKPPKEVSEVIEEWVSRIRQAGGEKVGKAWLIAYAPISTDCVQDRKKTDERVRKIRNELWQRLSDDGTVELEPVACVGPQVDRRLEFRLTNTPAPEPCDCK
jgi:hypothetical protein